MRLPADRPGPAGPARALVLAVVVTVSCVLAGCGEAPGPVVVAPEEPVGELAVELVDTGVFCDGTSRSAAVISGAEPGEVLVFATSTPAAIPSASADDDGRYELGWTCEPSENRLSWDVEVLGTRSGRRQAFQLKATDDDPELDGLLIYEAVDEAVVCDGNIHPIGQLSRAEPGESIGFVSDPPPDVELHYRARMRLDDRKARVDGRVDVEWSCSVAEAGQVWTVTATGDRSDRVVEFPITGQVPRPEADGPIAVEVVESPFVCDRGLRPAVVLSNLTPSAEVDFTSDRPGETLSTGRAGVDGTMAVQWRCDRSEAGTAWRLTATERTADARSVTIDFTGAEPGTTVAAEVIEDPFVCNGETRMVAMLTNFVGGEFIDFTSDQADGLRQGQAESDGSLPVRWTCTADQVGTEWQLTATGATSGASVTFTITGVES